MPLSARGRTMRLPNVIVMSCVLGWLGLTGCTPTPSPYLRDLRPSYDCQTVEDGRLHCTPLPGYYTMEGAWLEHMLKDLEACYKDADR